ncbi:TlpA disulfide reductase family protein [Aurantivibrio infirmus]
MKKFLLALIMSSFAITSANAATKLEGVAPDFTLPSNKNENIRLAEQRGEVIMINFWASWCGPCRQEMPILDELYSKYSRAGFKILGVNVDANVDDANKALKKIPVTFPVLFDTENKISELYDVSAMPTTIMIDRDGKMRYLHKGYKPGYEEDYRKQIQELIRE